MIDGGDHERFITFYQGEGINEEMEARSIVFDQRNDRRRVMGERPAGRGRIERSQALNFRLRPGRLYESHYHLPPEQEIQGILRRLH